MAQRSKCDGRRLMLALAVVILVPATIVGQPGSARHVPARNIPVPKTVSPGLQEVIARPLSDDFKTEPKTKEDWQKTVAATAAAAVRHLPQLRSSLHVRSESRPVGGVKTFLLTPATISPENRNRVLVHLHGGAYVLYPGESGTKEAILMAHHGGIRVISVDYRLAPEHPFPAALEDAVAVWKEVTKSHRAANIGLFGTSAGGGLTMATVLRLKELHLPLPGAIALGTPWCDITKTGDTWYTNEYIDCVVPYYEGLIAACARAYAGDHDPKEPLVSPVYGELRGFPPAILISGTRDVLLSDAARAHRKLRNAGVEAELYVFEGQSHAQYLHSQTDSPEAQEAYGEMARFFQRHLGRQ